MKSLRDWDSAGWGFFGFSFLVCFIPMAIWLPSVFIESDDNSAAVPYVFAAVVAVTAGGIITVIANTILQRLAAKREESGTDSGEEG